MNRRHQTTLKKVSLPTLTEEKVRNKASGKSKHAGRSQRWITACKHINKQLGDSWPDVAS